MYSSSTAILWGLRLRVYAGTSWGPNPTLFLNREDVSSELQASYISYNECFQKINGHRVL